MLLVLTKNVEYILKHIMFHCSKKKLNKTKLSKPFINLELLQNCAFLGLFFDNKTKENKTL